MLQLKRTFLLDTLFAVNDVSRIGVEPEVGTASCPKAMEMPIRNTAHPKRIDLPGATDKLFFSLW